MVGLGAVVHRATRSMARPTHPRASARSRVPGVGGADPIARPSPPPRPGRRAGHAPPVPLGARSRSRRVTPAPGPSRQRGHRRPARRCGRARRRRRHRARRRRRHAATDADERPACCPSTDRTIAGLPTSDARAVRLHRLLLAVVSTSAVTLTVPRGDLRATSQLHAVAMDRRLDRPRPGAHRRPRRGVAPCRARSSRVPCEPDRASPAHPLHPCPCRRRVDRCRRVRATTTCCVRGVDCIRWPSLRHAHGLRRRSVRRRPPATDRVDLAEPSRGVDGLPPRLLRALPPSCQTRRRARRRHHHHRARPGIGPPRRARPLPSGRHRR